MKKMFILFALVLFSTSLVAQDTMKFVYFENFPPYSWKENNKMKGILVDIITEVVQYQMGVQVSHEGYPWARAQLMVKRNEADAFVTIPTPERKSYTEISSEHVASLTATLFVSRGSEKINDLKKVKTFSDLKKFTLVNYIGNGWAKKNLAGMNVHWVPTIDKTLELIAHNRYQVYVGGAEVIRYNIKRLGYQDEILEIPNVIETTHLHLCVGKKSPFVRIMPEFNEAIITNRKSGKLRMILSKY